MNTVSTRVQDIGNIHAMRKVCAASVRRCATHVLSAVHRRDVRRVLTRSACCAKHPTFPKCARWFL
jgi:hypothetical protein